MPACGDEGLSARELMCRDSTVASQLKLISILLIFVGSAIGISSPMILAKSLAGKPVYEKSILVIKCYAAGVILSTALVHVLPDAFEALGDCVVSTLHPWKDFPFAGLFTLVGALLALLVDLAAISSHHDHCGAPTHYEPLNAGPCYNEVEGRIAEGNNVVEKRENEFFVYEEKREKMRQKMVSQVLEIGIVFHSIIIGATMGLSQNICTIKPLVAALAFHQIFEGMGLGGCIAQAGFSFKTRAYMCFIFSVTTPVGIVLGMMVYAVTGYDESSANALVSEGLLGSISSGILIYMALVDLISADFFHSKLMSSETKMKKGCFIALALGSASMSILALWT